MDGKQSVRKEFLVELSRWQVILGGVFAIVVPVASAYTSYLQSVSDIKQEFAMLRLESERAYVKKDEMAKVGDKLEQISDQLSEIKGYIRARDRRR
jgi:hypothetical protein